MKIKSVKFIGVRATKPHYVLEVGKLYKVDTSWANPLVVNPTEAFGRPGRPWVGGPIPGVPSPIEGEDYWTHVVPGEANADNMRMVFEVLFV